jgi:hypothetical protein
MQGVSLVQALTVEFDRLTACGVSVIFLVVVRATPLTYAVINGVAATPEVGDVYVAVQTPLPCEAIDAPEMVPPPAVTVNEGLVPAPAIAMPSASDKVTVTCAVVVPFASNVDKSSCKFDLEVDVTCELSTIVAVDVIATPSNVPEITTGVTGPPAAVV